MAKVSELEKYLRAQSSEGQKDSEGTFSISQDEALKKLAGFQLPFEGAWALKIIQAAVAAGGCESIGVTLSRSEQCFVLAGLQNWSLESVESALLDLDRGKDRSIQHLVTGLRGVGFSDLRGFWLGLPGEEFALTWDGRELKRLPIEHPVRHPVLNITCKALFEEGGFFGLSSLLAARERNATTQRVLATLAYTCPVPLELDGLRLDALEFNPHHGWGKVSQLLALGFAESDQLPQLVLPRRTGGVLSSDHPIQRSIKEATESTRTRPCDLSHCAVPFLVSAHLERVKSGKSHVWKERTSASHCNWVADGVVVQAEVANTDVSFCSLGWYVSADGLDVDLTSLYLRRGPEKERRYQESLKAVTESLQDLIGCDFSKITEVESQNAKTGGVILLVLGAGLSFASPFHGIGMLGFGAFSLISSFSAGKERERSLYRGLEELYRMLEELTTKTL